MANDDGKVVVAQRDFSGGEADAWLKRSDDHPLLKTSGRQMSNWRMLSSRGLDNRPGRRALALEGVRAEMVVMSPTNNFNIVFGNGYLRVYNAAWTKVLDSASTAIAIPWTAATAVNVIWTLYKYKIYITFAGMAPLVLTWDGVSQSSTWTLASYSTDVTGGQAREVFYRISPLGVTMKPSASKGAITLTFSSPIANASMVGTRFRYITEQVLVTGFVSSTVLNAQTQQTLHSADHIVFPGGTTPSSYYKVGDEVIGNISGAKGIVTVVDDASQVIEVQRFTATIFQALERVTGPGGSVACTSRADLPPQAVTVWDDEVMNSYRGYPASCFVDQGRLGLCDFAAVPQLVVWSAIGVFTDLYTDSNNVGATNAIQEIMPGNSRVLYVVPGMEGSEFVFCDNIISYIPINENNPLKPGSVSFKTLSISGAAAVQPRRAQQSLLYIGAGDLQMKAVQAIGAYNRPYIIDDLTELHSHLINNTVAIAVPSDDQFEENYIYALNADGTMMVSKFNIVNGIIDAKAIGWLPWSGGGTLTWVSAQPGRPETLLTGTYAPTGAAAVSVVEQIDKTQYLDAAMLYNTVPAALTPPGGKGPLWWLAGGQVDLMDGLRMMGTYSIDANGFLVAQNNAGEDFTSVTLTCGQAWTATLEPWVPPVQPGQDAGQRMRKRRVARVQVYVQNSTGFTFSRLFAGPITSTSPALGTVMSRSRVPAWNVDDNPTVAPPLREKAYAFRPLGRSHDPRNAIIKDTPGPLTILEYSQEVTV